MHISKQFGAKQIYRRQNLYVTPVQRFHKNVTRSSSQHTNDERLNGTPQTSSVIPDGNVVLDVSETQQDDDGDGNGDEQSIGDLVHDEVRNHGYQTTDEVAEAHGDAGNPGAVNVWLVEAQRKVHAETDPLLAVLAELVYQGSRRGARDVVLFQDAKDVVALLLREAAVGLLGLAKLLGLIDVSLRDGGEVGAQAHADHAGEELGQAAHDDELCAAQAGEAGCEGKGDGEAV